MMQNLMPPVMIPTMPMMYPGNIMGVQGESSKQPNPQSPPEEVKDAKEEDKNKGDE